MAKKRRKNSVDKITKRHSRQLKRYSKKFDRDVDRDVNRFGRELEQVTDMIGGRINKKRNPVNRRRTQELKGHSRRFDRDVNMLQREIKETKETLGRKPRRKNNSKEIPFEFQVSGFVFVALILMGLFMFKWTPVSSVILGAIGFGIAYFLLG